MMILNILHVLHFSQNQPLEKAEDYIIIFSLRVRAPCPQWQIVGAEVPGSNSSKLFYPFRHLNGIKNLGIFYVKKLTRKN